MKKEKWWLDIYWWGCKSEIGRRIIIIDERITRHGKRNDGGMVPKKSILL